MKKLTIILIILFLIGCSEEPTQPLILVQPPIITEFQYWNELENNSNNQIIGFYFHVRIEPKQTMYDLTIQLSMNDGDVLVSDNKGYAISKDRADVPFEYSPGEFPYNIMAVVDTTVWGYVAAQPVDILRLFRGWYEMTISYYTNNSSLSKRINHEFKRKVEIDSRQFK